jgi:hypothetical protein
VKATEYRALAGSLGHDTFWDACADATKASVAISLTGKYAQSESCEPSDWIQHHVEVLPKESKSGSICCASDPCHYEYAS